MLHLAHFVCGGPHFPGAYKCLDSCQVRGQCILGHLIVPVKTHNTSNGSHWSVPLSLYSCLTWELPRGAHDYEFASTGRASLPQTKHVPVNA